MDSRIDARKKDFKKSFEDPRRVREDEQVQISRANRDARLTKKRMTPAAPSGGIQGTTTSTASSLTPVPDVNELPGLVAALNSPDDAVVEGTAEKIRRMLSVQTDPPIDEVVRSGVVPRLVQLLDYESNNKIQYECAWSVTNISSGNTQHTTAVVQCGAIPALIRLLDSQYQEVREQAVWALANISGDSSGARDAVLQTGILRPLLRDLENQTTSGTPSRYLQNAAWALGNLCRGKPQPDFELLKPALPVLRKLLHSNAPEILCDAGWALSYLSDSSDLVDPHHVERINEVLKSGVCNRLVDLLNYREYAIQGSALRTIGNLLTGNDAQTQTVIACGVLPKLRSLLSHPKETVKKEACWAISNITAGNGQQLEEVILGGFIPILLELIRSDRDPHVRKEAAWAVSNAVGSADISQIKVLLEHDYILPALVEMLEVTCDQLVSSVLDAIYNVLRAGQSEKNRLRIPQNPYLERLEAAGAYDHFEKLQFSECETHKKKVVNIMNDFLMDIVETVEVPNQQQQQHGVAR